MNRFFAYLTQFIADTLVKSSDANARFGEVETGFSGVQDEMNCALRVDAAEKATDLARLPVAATRASKLLSFGPTGAPQASNQLPADLDANTKKITNLPSPATNTEPVTLGYLTAFAASLAGIPSIVGQAGKYLTTDGIGVQWTQPPVPSAVTADDGALITSFGGGTQWITPAQNLLLDPNGFLGNDKWTDAILASAVDEYGTVVKNTGAIVTQTGDRLSTRMAVAAGVNLIAHAGFLTAGVSAGTIGLLLKYYDSGDAALSESSITNVPTGQAGFKRYSKAVTTPASTAFVRLIVRLTGVSASASGLRIRNAKVEQGTWPSPYSDEATQYELSRYKTQYSYGKGQASVTSTLGDTSTTQSQYDLRSTTGSQAYDMRLKSTGGTNGTPGKGTATLEARELAVTGPVGSDTELANGNGGVAITVNVQAKQYQSVVLNNAGACAITLDGTKPPQVVGHCLRLHIKQDNAGGRPNPTWAGLAITWLGGTTPVVATAANAHTMVDFFWDGTTLFGSWTAWS
jgi:hypothetical protein